MNVMVTGGCGFIGANFILYWMEKHPNDHIINVDLCTYAAVEESLASIKNDERYQMVKELYKIFGLENGREILEEHFEEVSLQLYDDYLEVDDAELLCDYIYSCHGNQNTILYGRKEEFKKFIVGKMKGQKIRITKQAGMFVCRKSKYRS